MAKLQRKFLKIFGASAGASEIAQIGSLAAAAPQFTTDLELIQDLANYDDGWFECVLGANSPAIEDMNALFFLITSMQSYMFQAGVPEWNADTTYYIGSIVNDQLGNLYFSISDSNINHALTDTANWSPLSPQGGRRLQSSSASTPTEKYNLIECDGTAGSYTQRLPPLSLYQIGEQITIKCVNTNANLITLRGSGTETIDGANIYATDLATMDSLTVYKSSTTAWYVK